jgi:large subunit ribosomal protein L1
MWEVIFMEFKENIQKALNELKKDKERKFNQSIDLIINLKKFDVKKSNINLFVLVPYKIKDKKIAAFLESRREDIDTITESEFKKYSDKKILKNLIKKYDFFISQARLMPKVATTFGRVLGPAGKMPSPQLGMITESNEKTIKEIKEKINKSVRIRVKEASIKLCVGKQSMKDEEIIENILTIYNSILKSLPRDKDNIKNIKLKFTMSKPRKVQ